MVCKLSQMIAPNTGNRDMDREWNMFTNMLRRPDLLTRVEVSGLKDMSDVFVILMDKGKINCGNYEVVKRIMSQLQLMQCHNIITEHEERMASTSQNEQHEERMASTSQDGQHKKRVASTSQGGQYKKRVASTSQGGQYKKRMASTSQNEQHEERMVSTSQDGQHKEQVTSTSQGGQYKKRVASTSQGGQYKKRVASTSQGGQYKKRMASISQDGQYKKRMVSTSQDGQHEEQVASTSWCGQYKKRVASTSHDRQHKEQVASTSQGSGQQGDEMRTLREYMNFLAQHAEGFSIGDKMRTLREDMVILAQHAKGFGTAETVHSRDTAASSHKMPPGKVVLVKQNIQLVYGSLEMEQADVIIFEVDSSLNPSVSGNVAKRLLTVGGKTLVEECKSRFPNGIKHGQVASINSGNLKCNKLYLFTLPVVLYKKEKEVKNKIHLLRTAISNIVNKAAEENVTSFAIPAIGVGTMNIPADDLAHIMFDLFTDERIANIDVKIVLYHKTTIQAFLRVAAQLPSGDEMRKLLKDVDILAQHAAGFGTAKIVYSWDTAGSSLNKMPTVDMEATVKVWEDNDKLCYETKGINDVTQRISSGEHSYICVVGEPGSGKSTAIRHAALYLKDKCGFTIYPVLGPKQFLDYLDRDKRQAFLLDDYLGEYFLDQDKLKVWNEYNEKIKDCLQVHKNTKFLFSLRIQLYSELKSKGNAPMCNDQRHVINFSDKEYKLNRDTMKAMLRHYLQVKHVQNIEGLIGRVWWGKAEQFAGCFPLLCKVFSEDESVRVNPEKYFSDPLPVLQNIFKRIQFENKHQFCGLLLCGITELKDEHLNPLSELNKPKHFNVLIKSQKLNPETDLEDIKQALDNLDGVYISHIGNRYTFLHSIFQNIVTFLYDNKYYVFKYATRDFIHERVRLLSKFDTDDDYVKVFYGDDCVELLVDRMIEELSDDTDRYWKGVTFIVYSHYIDNKELITCLTEKLFDSKHTRITQDKIHELFGECLKVVCLYTPSHSHTGETSCPQYQLLLSLIARCDCNRQIELWWYPLHLSVEYGLLHVTKALVEHQADVNVIDEYNDCVLHSALYCTNNVDMTKYLLSLPNLKCLNHRDSEGRTPYWFVVNNILPLFSLDGVPHRDELIQLYKHKAAIYK